MTATVSVLEAPHAREPQPVEAARPRPVPAPLQPWHDPHPLISWLVTLGIAVVAAFTRFWALGFPHSKVFDEVYYATEAQEISRYGYEDNRDYMFIVHPPLGKWLIAFGEHFADGSLGWRLGPAIAGVLAVIVMTRTAMRMFRSTLFGAIAGGLLALDGLSVVLSRTAILDIFLQLFVLAGFGALVVDRDQMRGRLANLLERGIDITSAVPSLGPRPWRVIAGVMFGCACAVKWTGVVFFVFFAILSVVWDRSAFRAAGVRQRAWPLTRRSIAPALGSLVAVPIGTYLLTYIGWFTGENSWNRHWADTHGSSANLHVPLLHISIPFNWGWVPAPIRSLGDYTYQAYKFHEGLDSGHAYQSSPWSWLVLGRPVDFYYDGSSKSCGGAACSREILLIGTPLIWWAFVPMLLWLAWHWVTTRDWRAGSIWVAFLAGWLFWFHDLKRTMFLFYMAPLVPFMILGITLALGAVLGPPARVSGDADVDRRAFLRRRIGIGAVSVYLGAVIADFVWMWPIFTGGLLTYEHWHWHMWLPSWV